MESLLPRQANPPASRRASPYCCTLFSKLVLSSSSLPSSSSCELDERCSRPRLSSSSSSRLAMRACAAQGGCCQGQAQPTSSTSIAQHARAVLPLAPRLPGAVYWRSAG
eukprot:scaffold156_cov308-Prasinococcus_capsulatus_cf.AAC.27